MLFFKYFKNYEVLLSQVNNSNFHVYFEQGIMKETNREENRRRLRHIIQNGKLEHSSLTSFPKYEGDTSHATSIQLDQIGHKLIITGEKSSL